MEQAVKKTIADRAAECAIYNFDGCEFVECKHALWAEIRSEIERLQACALSLSDFTDGEIAMEHHNRMMRKLGDPRKCVSLENSK